MQRDNSLPGAVLADFAPLGARVVLLAVEVATEGRADFLRSFGLARLPENSAVRRRASEMLLAQHQPRLALAAVEKALLADPMDQTSQRLRVEVLDATPER